MPSQNDFTADSSTDQSKQDHKDPTEEKMKQDEKQNSDGFKSTIDNEQEISSASTETSSSVINNNNTQKQYEEVEDYSAKLLTNYIDDSVYNDCTIPLQQSENTRKSLFSKNSISTCLSNSSSATPLVTDRDGVGGGGGGGGERGGGGFTMVDLGNSSDTSGLPRIHNDDEDTEGLETSIQQPRDKFYNKSSVRDDMIQSINSLRQNVNSHIIGGSKNVMGRMRKLSMSDLNRHGRSTGRKYKIAFYAALVGLSFLFLYLIYQNLFNDK